MSKIIKIIRKVDNTPAPKVYQRTPPVIKKREVPVVLASRDTGRTHYLLTCQSGLESLVKRECERLSLSDIHAQDRLVKCSGNEKNLYELLVWSRFANRVYLSLHESVITDFDALFIECESIDWSQYLTGRERIVIEASSTRSTLSSVPTIQSVAQKAIYSQMITPNTTNGTEVHILILVIDEVVHILLDVTGDPLHKRGYRTEAGEAPIKENLAAALVAFSGWKYRDPLWDPCCGSGTIAIEAAMMARNIAPGINRHFRIESLPYHDSELYLTVKKEAQEKYYPSGAYQIHASDKEKDMISISRANARRAGVADDIVFEVRDFLQDEAPAGLPKEKTIVTNPPYGNRLESREIIALYDGLKFAIDASRGGMITSYDIGRNTFANKKLLNGGEECRFWYKKN